MTDTSSYTPPTVWQWNTESGGAFSQINRPIAGATHEQELPIGQHGLQLYSLGTPNGIKVTILLEELLELGEASAEYDAWLIEIMKGMQFGSDFVSINPNSKIPALLDTTVNPPLRVFESGSILLYLAQKFGHFYPQELRSRTECNNWLFWQMASAPILGGGFGHFYVYAPEKFEYPINRFTMEVKRQMDVLNRHLSEQPMIAGIEYSIADIAIWPWYGRLVLDDLYPGAGSFISAHEYTHVLRWAESIAQRPAVKRGLRVNNLRVENGLRERHSAADFLS